jgi:uncharacterized protein (DUF1015 family)
MSILRSLSAIRYETAGQADLSARLSPPYDVLGEDDKRTLLQQDPRNFVKIDLPHTPPNAAGPPAAYAGARATLDAWLADGTLVRDAAPAIYVYHQRFAHDGREYRRRMFFARLKLEPFGEGSVFPHERTFGGPKEDRLALMKATAAALSPIFGLYSDPSNQISKRLAGALTDRPLAHGTMAGVENLLWTVTDTATIADVARTMADKPTYIADGHHRYGTAMLYREWLAQQGGPLPPDHPANYVLCVFCAMEDPGLLILPTHRVLAGEPLTSDLFRRDSNVAVAALRASSPDEVPAELRTHGPQAVALYSAAERRYFTLRPARPELLSAYEPQRSEAWRKLALAFLHAYLLDRVVAPQRRGSASHEIRYIKSAGEAVRTADATHGAAFLLQPTTLAELSAVCLANDLMPQKSTFFYPKLASGLIVYPLSD